MNGVLELLMNNPNDVYPWLGLLQIRKSFQGQGRPPVKTRSIKTGKNYRVRKGYRLERLNDE